MVNDEGGGERARGAARRFEADEEDDDELGREKSDSESDGEEFVRLEIEGGEMVGLGVQPTGERERELIEDEEDDLRLEKLVKASIAVIMELSELDVFVVCRLGLCRLLEVESQTRMS